MTNRISGALLAGALLLPIVGAAQENQRPTDSEFSYTYVEISYDEIDFDVSGVGDIDGDGLTVSGAYELTDDWHVYASYGNSDLDFGIDLDTLAIGAGYVYPLNQDVDIYGRVLYIDQEVDVPGFGDVGDDGLGLQGPHSRAHDARARAGRWNSVHRRAETQAEQPRHQLHARQHDDQCTEQKRRLGQQRLASRLNEIDHDEEDQQVRERKPQVFQRHAWVDAEECRGEPYDDEQVQQWVQRRRG